MIASLAYAALPLLAAAQYGYEAPSAPAASSAAAPVASAPAASSAPGTPTIHRVVVGGSSLVYTPNFVNAAVGDRVEFTFMAKNHSVVQSSFATPCAPMAGGINSGFMPSTGGASAPVYTVPVNATTPTWFYCSQGTHCAAGMGFAINPPASGNTITAFIAKAMAGAAANGTTGGAVASGTGAVGSAAGSATAGAAAATTSARAGASTLQIGGGLAAGLIAASFFLV